VEGRLDARFAEARFCWDGTRVRVLAKNVGASTIDALNVSVVVDGIVHTGFTATVDGRPNAGFWEPDTNATFRKAGFASEPSRVVLFTPEGIAVHAPPYDCPVLRTIAFAPASASLAIGDSLEVTAVGYDQYGEPYDPEPYVWTSPCGTVEVLDDDRARFTAGTVAGPCALTASSEDERGDLVLTIRPDAPATLTVSPDSRDVPAGGTASFSAVARDQYGNVNETSPISWSTTAGSIDDTGVLTAQTTAQLGLSVTAVTTGGVTGSALVDVHPAEPATATVTPDPVDVTAGASQAFSVVLHDAYGNVNATAPVVWTTDAGGISDAGVLTARTTAQDGLRVTATSGGASGSATVHVKPGAPASIVVTPHPVGVAAGETRQFGAVAYDAYGNVNDTAELAWSTDAGTIDGSGLLTAQTTAQTGRSVTATSAAASGSATVDVWPGAPASAVVTPEGAGVTAGGTQQYGVLLHDAYGNVNATAPVAWSTDGGSIDGNGLLTAQTLAATGRTVTATSGAASDSATFDVLPAAPATITVTPGVAGVPAGAQQAFSAVARDAYGNVNSTAPIAWSTTAGSITSGGVLTAQTTAQNGLSVTATSGGASGSATVDVWPDAPSTVTVAPSPRGVPAGGTATFAATVRDQHGNVNATASVSWSTNAGSITSGGVLTAQTTAQTGRSVTATAGSASGSATVDVYPAAVDRIVVSPASATLYLNRTQQFTVTVYDAYNNVNASVAVSWSATGGSITTGGLYTAPSVGGSVTVTASAEGKSGTATVTVRREAHVDAMATYKAGVPSSSFRKGQDTVDVRTTVRDHENNLVRGGATVTIEFVSAGGVEHTATGTTDAHGVASVSYALPQSARTGEWTARVTSIAGTHLVYASGANVVSSVSFSVVSGNN